MPLTGTAYVFSKENVDKSPAESGVYALYDEHGACIYIGRAKGGTVTIRSRLQSHQRGNEGRCTWSASTYRRDVCTNPVTRELQLLEEHMLRYGRLPQCNERLG